VLQTVTPFSLLGLIHTKHITDLRGGYHFGGPVPLLRLNMPIDMPTSMEHSPRKNAHYAEEVEYCSFGDHFHINLSAIWGFSWMPVTLVQRATY
jgi:hypothetical protein